MVHTVLLVNLRHKICQELAYAAPEGYTKPEDDIIMFAFSALKAGTLSFLTNNSDPEKTDQIFLHPR